MNIVVGDTISNSIAYTLSSLKSKLSKVIKPRKKVHFADENGGVLEITHVYNVPSRNDQTTEQSNVDGTVDVEQVKNHITNYQIVFDENKLLEKGISVIAYGIIAEQSIFGAVEVKNITYDKNIFVRLTLDKWKTFTDVPAKFSRHDENERSDRFFFIAPLDDKSFGDIKSDIEFATCYKLVDNDFWDNNNGNNYSFYE